MIFYLQHWEEVIKKMATEQEVFKGEVFHIALSIGSKHFMLHLPVQKKVTLLIFFSCRSTEWYFETEAGDWPHEHHSDTAGLLRQVYRLGYWKTGSKVGFSIHFIYFIIWKYRAVFYDRTYHQIDECLLIINLSVILFIDQ